MKTRLTLTLILMAEFLCCRGQVFSSNAQGEAFQKYYRHYWFALNASPEHNYFYGIYRHHSLSLLQEKDSVLIRKLMHQAIAGKLPEHFYWNYTGLSKLRHESDSVLVHGYKSIVQRDYKTVFALPVIHYNSEQRYRIPRESIQLFKRKPIPYYLQENRYKRLDEIRRNDRKE